MKIYLIRHGKTDWNMKGKIQGSTDIPLNEEGIIQARALAEGMEARPVTQIFTSPLKRAMATAEAIGERQNIPVQQAEGLVEVGFGYWEGLTWEEIQREYPEEYRRWCLNPVDVAPPGGELQRDIRLRCRQVVEALLAQAKGDMALVSHGATIAYILEYLMRDHPLEEEIIVHNASITTIHYSPLTQDFSLLQMNDTRHLERIAKM